MADYTQPDAVRKRVRFFDGQFVQDQDFIDEQKYHLDRERRAGRSLGVSGIVEGLAVAAGPAFQVVVGRGSAVDALGRHLVLTADLTLTLPAAQFARRQNVEVRIVYREIATDVAQVGGKSAGRWEESPVVAAVAPDGTVAVAPSDALTTWDGPSVLLASITVSDAGALAVDTGPAARAGIRVPGAVAAGGLLTAAGNVGVGTGAPENAESWRRVLDVLGDVSTKLSVRTANVDARLMAHDTGFLGAPAGGIAGTRSGHPFSLVTSGAARLTVTAAGNVGIGTTDPENADGWSRVLDVLGGRHAKLSVRSAGIDGRVMAHETGFFGSPGGMVVGTRTSHPLSFATAAATRMTITSGGNVGIGLADPLQTLTVRSAGIPARFQHTDPAATGTQLLLELVQEATAKEGVRPAVRFEHLGRFWQRIEADEKGFHLRTGVMAANDWVDLTARNVYANGNLGVGTTAPENADGWARVLDVFGGGNAKLSVRTTNVDGRVMAHDTGFFGSATGMVVGTKSAHALSLATGAATRMSITSAGKVGIGTTDPLQTLTVRSTGIPARFQHTDPAATGTQLMLELVQEATAKDGTRPAIRFEHLNRFWQRIEADEQGFHLRTGTLGSDEWVDLTLRNLWSTGQIYFQPGTPYGTENGFGNLVPYWRLYRDRWNTNDTREGVPTVRATTFPFPSDARLKRDTTELVGALDRIERIRGVTFHWNERGLDYLTAEVDEVVSAGPAATDEQDRAVRDQVRSDLRSRLARSNVGFVAQEVEAVLPEVVFTDHEGIKKIDYSKITALLVQAVKEQQESIRQLQSRLS